MNEYEDWIKGNDLLSNHWNISYQQLKEWVIEGRLIPYFNASREQYERLMRRVVPDKYKDKYQECLELTAKIEDCRYWLEMSLDDFKNIAFGSNTSGKNLCEILEEKQSLKANEYNDAKQKLGLVENELDPAKIWHSFNQGTEHLKNIIFEAEYKVSDVKALTGAIKADDKPKENISNTDYISLIEKTNIDIIDDEHIKITAPINKTFNHTRLTSKFSKKEWDTFRNILEYGYKSAGINPRDKHKSGVSNVKEYDNTRKTLYRINIKLIRLFRKEFGLDIPHDFKFIKVDKTNKDAGVYKPSFITKSERERLQVLKMFESKGISMNKLKENL